MVQTAISIISALVALVAVAVAMSQLRTIRNNADKANALPVVSETFNEFRSVEFQEHLRVVWNEAPREAPEDGFEALPEDWRESAYEVAYFFERLGILVAYDLVPQNLVLDFSANMLGRTWMTLAPFITAEREFRRRTSPPGISTGFVTHFEHLVALTVQADGTPVDAKIHQELHLRQAPAGMFVGRREVPSQRAHVTEQTPDSISPPSVGSGSGDR